jgi:hypothetical protein
MSEIMNVGEDLGIMKPKKSTMEDIPKSEQKKTQPHLEKMILPGTDGIRKNETEIVPGKVGYVGSTKWERVPVNEVSFCSKCGDLLGSQYGVVEYGSTDGPYYCTPEHLQETKGTGI